MYEKKVKIRKEEEMKSLKIIHNIFTVTALIVAMYIGGGIEATRSDITWSYIIFFIVVLLLAARFIYEDKKQNKDSLWRFHCLILVFVMFISPVRRATAKVAQIGRVHVIHEVDSSNLFPGSTLLELSTLWRRNNICV